MTAEGLFEGRIITGTGQQYIIERAARYFEPSPGFHSVIYREEDVIINNITSSLCQADKLHEKLFQKQKNLTLSRKANPPDNQHGSILHKNHHKAKYTSQYPLPGRHKRGIDHQKTTCTLYVQADHLFYRKFGSNQETVIEQLTQHVQGVNEIYKKIGK